MPAVLGIQFFVHLVLLGHEQVQKPVFLLVHQARLVGLGNFLLVEGIQAFLHLKGQILEPVHFRDVGGVLH